MPSKDVFTADIFPFYKLDPSGVYGAGQYIVLTHIVRPIIKLNKHAQIEGDLVESWEISNDHKTFKFKIKPNAKWSDGTNIESNDVKRSILRQKTINKANHFNFDLLKDIIVNNEREFTIHLKQKNMLFIRHLSYPEFGIIDDDDSSKEFGKLKFKKVSGPYIPVKNNENNILLKKNPFYPFESKTAPENIRFISNSSEDKLKLITDGKTDFVIPFTQIPNEKFKEIINNNKLSITHPHIGYTFWLLINPNSKKLSDKSLTNWIQRLIIQNDFQLSSESKQWVKANQLYLPDGLGRPSEKELKEVWDNIKEDAKKPLKKIKLSLLIGSDSYFPFNKTLIALLEKHFLLNIEYFESSKDCRTKMLNKSYDLVLKANDFSSADLHENLQTTFNPNYSLILTDKQTNQFQSELKIALKTSEENKRHKIYKEIAKKVLTNGYIAPIAFQNVIFIHKKKANVSSWSSLFPELSLWKMSINN